MTEQKYHGAVPENIEAVIFDIDGTVWDILPIYFQAVSEVLKKYDIPPVKEDFLIAQLKYGESFKKIITHTTSPTTAEIDPTDLLVDVKSMFRYLEEETVQPYPDVLGLFSALKIRNKKIGLATGRLSPRERIRKICIRMAINNYIDAVTSQLYVQHRKPAPDLIIDCAANLEVPIDRCIIVGDTRNDILAANNAGGTAIGVLTGLDSYDEMMMAEPFAIINNVKDILLYM